MAQWPPPALTNGSAPAKVARQALGRASSSMRCSIVRGSRVLSIPVGSKRPPAMLPDTIEVWNPDNDVVKSQANLRVGLGHSVGMRRRSEAAGRDPWTAIGPCPVLGPVATGLRDRKCADQRLYL